MVRMIAFHLQGVLCAIENVNTQLSDIVAYRDIHIREMIMKVENRNVFLEERAPICDSMPGRQVMERGDNPSVDGLEDVQRGMMEGIKSFLKPSVDLNWIKMRTEI